MTDRPAPTGTISFLFTDIEGSTRKWQADPTAMGQAVARHDELMRGAIAAHAGHVFKTVGDAFCAAFPTVRDAFNAAIDAQQALHSEPWVGVDAIRARMAIHVGAAEERDNDYFGPPVNRTARLLSAGHGGQVLLSLPATELIHDHLSSGLGLRDLGQHRLKDLDRAEHIYQVVIPELPTEFPPLNTVDSRPNNLPLELTAFVGRSRELERIRELLIRPEVRLLTLMGPGGIGKTRLAIQAAAELIDDYPDGVFFVQLAAISDPDLVVPEIAEALLVREVPGQPLVKALQDHLHAAKLLLVLDNFEQVTAAAPILPSLLRACPQIKVIVTSRSVLRVSGEHEFAVPVLGLPPSGHAATVDAQQALESDAVQLFRARARAVKGDFDLTDENTSAIVEICRRLDGLPLAIELAAARIRMLTPQAMLSRLESRLKLLTGGGRDLPERQQTLRGAISWSYDLLPPEQQTLMARMSVFARGATFEAAELVCSGLAPINDLDELVPVSSEIDEIDVFDGIGALVDHSLLRQDEESGEARFSMLETIREFGLERLAEMGEVQELRCRHALHFLAFAEDQSEKLIGAEQASTGRLFDAEHDNLRAALAWALEFDAVELSMRLSRSLDGYWQLRGFLTEGRNLLERVVAESGEVDPTLRARVLNNLGNLANDLGDYDRAESAYEESLAVWRAMDDRRAMATVLNNLGQVAGTKGDYARARQIHFESLAIREHLGDRHSRALPLYNLGVIAHHEGDLSQAGRFHEEALAIRRSMNDPCLVAYSTSELAHVLHHEGNADAALELLSQAIALFREVGDRTGLAESLSRFAEAAWEAGRVEEAFEPLVEGLTIWREIGARRAVSSLETVARLSADQQRTEQAVRLLGAADALRTLIGEPPPPVILKKRRALIDRLRAELGEAEFDTALSAGKVLEPERAITEAIVEVKHVRALGKRGREARAEPVVTG